MPRVEPTTFRPSPVRITCLFQTAVEIQLLIEDSEERLSDQQVEQLLEIIRSELLQEEPEDDDQQEEGEGGEEEDDQEQA